MRIPDERVPVRASGVISRAVGDEFVVIDTNSEMAHALSGPMASAWRAIEQGEPTLRGIDEAVAHLSGLGLLTPPVRAAEVTDPDLTDLPAEITRRRLMANAEMTFAGAGVISVLLPAASAAASCAPGGVFTPFTQVSAGSFGVAVPAGTTVTFVIVGAGGAGGGNVGGGAPGSGGNGSVIKGTIENTNCEDFKLLGYVGGGGEIFPSPNPANAAVLPGIKFTGSGGNGGAKAGGGGGAATYFGVADSTGVFLVGIAAGGGGGGSATVATGGHGGDAGPVPAPGADGSALPGSGGGAAPPGAGGPPGVGPAPGTAGSGVPTSGDGSGGAGGGGLSIGGGGGGGGYGGGGGGAGPLSSGGTAGGGGAGWSDVLTVPGYTITVAGTSVASNAGSIGTAGGAGSVVLT